MENVMHIAVLIWKNFKVQIRQPWKTTVVILTPIISMFLLILFRTYAGSDRNETEIVFDSYDINALPEEEYNTSEAIYLYYAPESPFIDKVMKDVAVYLNVTSIGFNNEDQLEASYLKTHSKVVAGVIFHSHFKDGPQFFGAIEYTIRPEKILGLSWNLSSIRPIFPFIDLTDKSTYGTYYMNYGFLTIQHVVAKSLFENVFSNLEKKFDDMFVVQMRRQPYPPYEVDSFYHTPDFYVAFAICIVFLFPSVLIAKRLVHEKQIHLKQMLLLMGIANWENWIAWFIKDFILLSFCCIIMNAMLCIKFGEHAVLNKSDTSLILLWLILYATSVITFNFFVSTFFDKETSAASAACILFMLTFLPYIHRKSLFLEFPSYASWILCLLPNTLFAFSVRTLLDLELFGQGLQWRNMYGGHGSYGRLNMNLVFILLIADIFIYLILTWYIEVMWPAQFQRNHPWYFPFTATYWSGSKNIPPLPPLHKYHFFTEPDFFEKDPSKVKPMIDIRNLTKAYSRHSKPVIDRIDLRAYKGQVTVLLGSNCSGKTTFASMIYGAVLPTAGTILLKGHNICESRDLEMIAPLLGICPDFNVFIEELNIEENIYFFCRAQGYDSGLGTEMSHILATFDLEIKKKRLVSSLSYNSRRRLSVAIALAGESEIVILDEPTLHMDTYSRRITWDAIHLEKKTRAIFITTSHIKEANAVADKIAVLQHGQLKCIGSPLFLKKKYGAGYLLIVSKQPECSSVSLKNVIFSKIPSAIVTDDTESELKVILPHDACTSYECLFKELEEKDLKIKSIFVTETELDELYEKISGGSLRSNSIDLKKIKNEYSLYRYFGRRRNEGFVLFCQHLLALLKKKFTYSRHKLFLTASLIFIFPIIIIIASLLKERENLDKEDFHNESIFNLKEFGTTNIAYGIDPSSNNTIRLGDTYATLLHTEHLHLIDLDETNYQNYLINLATKDMYSYKTKYIIGAVFKERFNRSMITAFYNADAYHSAPTSLLYVHNTILKYYAKESLFYFNVKNHPLPFKDKEGELWSSDFDLGDSFLWAQDFMTGMAILMSSFIVLLVIEKTSESKQQQIISGLNAFVYWITTFIYDFGLYIIACLLIFLTLSIFQTECLSQDEEISFLAYLLLLHGLSALLFVYCCTFCFTSASIAYMGIFLYYFLGLTLLCIVYSLESSQMYHISEPLNTVFTAVMPSYCFGRGIYNIHRNCKSNFICNNNITQNRCFYRNATFMVSCCLDYCEDFCMFWSSSHSSLSISGIGKQLIALIVQPFFFCIILILFEMGIFQNLKLYSKEKNITYQNDLPYVDRNVHQEAKKVLTSPLPKLIDENHYLILRDASKLHSDYSIGKISFAVNKGECFGLFGIDRAGKSTILKLISGSVPLSTGNIYIDGASILEYPNKVQDKIGISFGNRALLKQLSVKETLTFYSRIRGIPENEIPYIVKILTNILSLDCDVLIKNCNIINQRKVCVAIAIIGTPPLILLDEPTNDMDPESYQNIIEAIKHAMSIGCTVLLTTTKFGECEALCNRTGHLVQGKLTYIGDFDHLLSQYADGFTVILRVLKSRQAKSRHTRQAITLKGHLEETKGLMEDTLPQAILKIEHLTFLNYYVPDRQVKWSKLFTILEKMKFQDMIQSYSVCETNLEQIFSYHVVQTDYTKDTKIAEFLKARRKEKV